MLRLNGEDAGFLYMDLPGQPMCTMAVGTFAAGEVPVTLADLRRHLLARLPELPSFRWRIVRVPLRLHHPECVDDPDFDLDFHLRTAPVDAPGGDLELNALFASIAERHLDQRHPLWQATLVSGLANGRQALILKYHHCLADGVAALTTFSRVFADPADRPGTAPGTSPSAGVVASHAATGQVRPTRLAAGAVVEPGAETTLVSREPRSSVIPPSTEPSRPVIGSTAPTLPSRSALVGRALRDHARSLPATVSLAATTRKRMAATKARQAEAEVQVPGFSGQAPRTVLNDAFTGGRTYTRVALPLADVRAVKDAAGVTLNDVVLATVAGATRRYLAQHGEVPALPLLASVPVSAEPAGAPARQSGNHFWSFTTSLATDIDDPLERLRTISAVTREAREQLEVLGTDLMPQWLDLIPPLAAQPGAKALVDRLRKAEMADANILVSNIRGPAEPWTLFGRTLEDLYVDGPPSNGVGCNVMLWSYGDRLLFGILAFASALRHPADLTAAVTTAFEELQTALAATST